MARPADAWWDDRDQEWVHGARDAEGRLVGLVRYWNADGLLISTCEHVAGAPHGEARRFYANGEVAQTCHYIAGVLEGVRAFLRPQDPDLELPRHLAEANDGVAAFECVYERGDLIGTGWRDGAGREVDQHGRPIRKRPANLPPTASPLPSSGWIYMRRRGEDGSETIESREYYETGVLKQESLRGADTEGTERAYYQTGQLAYDGRRHRAGTRHYKLGAWRHHDDKGQLRFVAEYTDGEETRRTWHRKPGEAKRGGVTREGPIDRGVSVGTWVVRDAKRAVIAELDLGPYLTDAELLAHAVTADELDDAIGSEDARDRSLVAVLARARRAGRDGEVSRLALDPTPAWKALDDDTGKLAPLAKHTRYDFRFVGLVDALRWGPPDGPLLAEIAAALFRADHAQAALDVIDAARLVGKALPAWATARAAYLRAVGRTVEADVAVGARPSRLDDRALALLAEIRANPDDDGPRLVFADHVAAAFPEHTALIVAQCGSPVEPPQLQELARRFTRSLPRWIAEYGTPIRGFLEGPQYFPAKEFVETDPDVPFRANPTKTRLDLVHANGVMAQLVTMPALRRYDELELSETYLFDGAAAQLARCVHLAQLVHLGLYATSLDDDDLRAIVTSTAYPRLASLDISNGREEQDYTMASFAGLADAAFAPTLATLAFRRRWFGDEAIPVLAKLPALTSIDMNCCSLSDDGAAELAALPLRLTHLDVDHSQIGPAGARALADGAALATLRSLSIKASPVGDAGAIAIATSRNLAQLQRLRINGDDQRVGPAFAEALATGPLVPSLVELEMSLATIGPAGAQALARGAFPNLTSLNLHNNAVGDAGAQAIAKAPWMRRMRHLDLSGCQITDAGANALAAMTDTHEELWIELGGATLTARTKRRLADRFGGRLQLEYPWGRR